MSLRTEKKEHKEIGKLLHGKTVDQIRKKLCGERLGYGLHRHVYVFKQFPEYVIKLERDMGSGQFANVTEWRNYINHKDWKWLGRWLAPCVTINETGSVMVQKRVTPGKRKDYPTHIPCLFTDLKLANFGWIGDQFVCCDYAYLLNMVIIGKRSNMKYAKWWNHNPEK